MNIFEALRESHVIQRNLAERLLQTSGDTPERRELFERLKNELFAHAVAEDRYFYIPLMMTDSGLNITRHALAEHHKMDELLEQLTETEFSIRAGWQLQKNYRKPYIITYKKKSMVFSASRKNFTRCSKDCARQAVSAGIQKVQKN
jgi:iron-sulfur cluster repair protein YtfE (RIC family)